VSKDINIIELSKNYGWSGGNNHGALFAQDVKYFLFLNDDVILESNALYYLIDSMQRNNQLGAAQPIIINRNNTINRGLGLAFSGLHSSIYYTKEPFYLSGSALLTRANVFFKIGMFDENFFLYHDDVDYCWRLRLAGYKITVVKKARAYHYGSATLGRENPLQYYFVIRNNLWVLIKNSSLLWLPIRLFLMFMETFTGFFIKTLLIKRNIKYSIVIIRAFLDGIKGLPYAHNERSKVMKYRSIKDKEINKVMCIYIDISYLFSPLLRILQISKN